MITLNWGGATDVGLVREHNEDNLLAQAPVFVVADGMGGHAAGEEASAIVVREFAALAGGPTTDSASVLSAIDRSNGAIVAAAQADPLLEGMGTTLVGLALVREHADELWLVFNVGDSRIYRLARGALELLSVDHSEVQLLVEVGAIAEEERRAHPRGNVITRALGTVPSPAADCWLLWPVAGERFLLCSDGLTGELTDEAIMLHMSAVIDPGETARNLVSAAVAVGARDNVTAVVVDVLAVDGAGTDPAATNPRSVVGS